MKKLYLITAFSIVCLTGFAQTSFKNVPRLPEVDKSPLDMSYFPSDYPILKIQNKVNSAPVARVIYSRPMKNGRTVFGELIEYGKVWRLGANEATELEFFQDVKLDGKKISKGRYSFFAIPEEDKWTIIVNTDTDCWGAFKYDASKDVLRTDIPVQKTEATEAMAMIFEAVEGKSKYFNLIIAWDDVKVQLPFSL